MEQGSSVGLRELVEKLRAITPDSGVAAVLRTVAESARRAAFARFAAIVPSSANSNVRLITVAIDGGQDDLPSFDAAGSLSLAGFDEGHAHRLMLKGRKLIRVPIEVSGTEFCVLYLADPIGGSGFETGSIDWLDDIAALAGLAVEHAIYNEEHASRAQWASAFETVHRDGRGQQMTAALQEIAQTAMRLSQTQCAAVATPTGDFVEVRAAAGAHADRLRGSVVPAGLSLMGQVIATLEYDVVDDACRSDRTYVPLSEAVDLGPALVIPLQHQGVPIGSLLLGNQRGGAPVDVSRVVEQLSVDARLRLVLGIDGDEAADDAAPLLALRETPLWDPRLNFLTRRELMVFGLLGEGLTNAAIAEMLFLSEKTVRNYVSNTLTKLGMRRVEAAVLSARMLSAIEPRAEAKSPR